MINRLAENKLNYKTMKVYLRQQNCIVNYLGNKEIYPSYAPTYLDRDDSIEKCKNGFDWDGADYAFGEYEYGYEFDENTGEVDCKSFNPRPTRNY